MSTTNLNRELRERIAQQTHAIKPAMTAAEIEKLDILPVRAMALAIQSAPTLRQVPGLVETVNDPNAGANGVLAQQRYAAACKAISAAGLRVYEKGRKVLLKSLDGHGPALLIGEAIALADRTR